MKWNMKWNMKIIKEIGFYVGLAVLAYIGGLLLMFLLQAMV